jgi:spore germination protein GerM
MRRIVPLALLIVLGAVAAGIYLGRAIAPPAAPENAGQPPGRQVTITRPEVRDNEFVLQSEKRLIKPGEDPVKQTVEELLKTADDGKGSSIPSGTRLVSLTVNKGLAVIELSDEFKMLNRHGESVQANAQNALRKALAQFPEIRKMRVLVGGKVFEDGHSGAWDEIPVRDDAAKAGGAL